MLKQTKERRYQRIWRQITEGKPGQIWKNYFSHYGTKGWDLTKKILWTASTGAIMLLLPLALEATIEGETQAQYISSQIAGGGINPNVQYRPY